MLRSCAYSNGLAGNNFSFLLHHTLCSPHIAIIYLCDCNRSIPVGSIQLFFASISFVTLINSFIHLLLFVSFYFAAICWTLEEEKTKLCISSFHSKFCTQDTWELESMSWNTAIYLDYIIMNCFITTSGFNISFLVPQVFSAVTSFCHCSAKVTWKSMLMGPYLFWLVLFLALLRMCVSDEVHFLGLMCCEGACLGLFVHCTKKQQL